MRVIGLPSVHSINSLREVRTSWLHTCTRHASVIATLRLGLRAPLVARNIIMISFIQVSCNLSTVC